MTTTHTAAHTRLIVCSVIASTTFAMFATDLRSEWRIGRPAGGPAPSSLPAATNAAVPLVQTWAEVTNVPDAGVNTGG